MTTTTVLLAPGPSELESDDVTLEDGVTATLSVVGQGREYGFAAFFLRKKGTAGYSPKGPPSESLNNSDAITAQVSGPITFKVRRAPTTASAGIEIERS